MTAVERLNRPSVALALLAVAMLPSGCKGKDKGDGDNGATNTPPGASLVAAKGGVPAAAPPARRYVGTAASAYFGERVPLDLERAEGSQLTVAQTVLPVGDTALAVLSSVDSGGPIVELIDTAAAKVVWTDRRVCGAPAVYADAKRVLCASWSKVRALSTADGTTVWESADKLAVAGAGIAVTYQSAKPTAATVADLDAGTTTAVRSSRFRADKLIEVCRDGAVVRLFTFDGKPGPGLTAWELRGKRLAERGSVAAIALGDHELCARPAVVETRTKRERTLMTVDLSRGPMRQLGAITGIDGWWLARGRGHVESTAGGVVTVRDKALASIDTMPTTVPPTERVASSGSRRLLRMTDGQGMALLEGGGGLIWLGAPRRAASAVLTDKRLLAAGWLPPAKSLRVDPLLLSYDIEAAPRGLPTPAASIEPMRGLPEPVLVDKKPGAAVPLSAADKARCTLVASRKSNVFAALVAADGRVGMAMFDAAARKWRWSRASLFDRATSIQSMGATDDVVVFALRTAGEQSGAHALEAATGRPLWHFKVASADAVAVSRDVTAVFHGDQVSFVATADGKLLYRVRSPDGYRAQAAAVTGSDGRPYTMSVETDGALVLREPAKAGAPRFTVGVRGRVERMVAFEQAVAVELTSGEMVGVEVPGGRVRVLPLRADRWHVTRGKFVIRDTPAAGGLRALSAFDVAAAAGPKVALTLSPGARVLTTVARDGWLFFEGGARRVTWLTSENSGRRVALPSGLRFSHVAAVPGGGVAVTSTPVVAHPL